MTTTRPQDMPAALISMNVILKITQTINKGKIPNQFNLNKTFKM